MNLKIEKKDYDEIMVYLALAECLARNEKTKKDISKIIEKIRNEIKQKGDSK